MFEIGRRAMLTAASDLVAMGASPNASLSALTLPDTIDDALFDELIAGIADGAERSGAHVIGGNLSRGDTLSITTTVIGSVKNRAVLRSLASVGDSIYVTGRPGESALGLNVLLNKLNAEGPESRSLCRRVAHARRALSYGRAASCIGNGGHRHL